MQVYDYRRHDDLYSSTICEELICPLITIAIGLMCFLSNAFIVEKFLSNLIVKEKTFVHQLDSTINAFYSYSIKYLLSIHHPVLFSDAFFTVGCRNQYIST